jgi:peroxiredoxin
MGFEPDEQREVGGSPGASPYADVVSLYHLPPGLPVPLDDGACDHVEGLRVPSLVLASSQGQIDVGDLAATRAVLYIYPRTGRPDRPVPEGWDAVPGARGCTPQSCAFRDRAVDLGALDVRIAGLSSQPIEEQAEFAAREHIPFPVIADPALELARALRCRRSSSTERRSTAA